MKPRDFFEATFAASNYVLLFVDVRAQGVVLPESARTDAARQLGVCMLCYGNESIMKTPIGGLDVGDDGVEAVLHFPDGYSNTYVPFSAVRSMKAMEPPAAQSGAS